MSQLRIGLIGYGSWTQNAYLPALRQSGRAQVVSAAASSVATRQRIGHELGNEIHVCDGFAALLEGPELDAVMIAVPDFMHEQALSAALAAGIAVFYEPPVAHTRQRILPMLGRLMAAPQITHADLELGYIPVVERAAELVRTGGLGRIQTVCMRLQSSWGAEPHNDMCTIDRLSPWYVDVLNHILDATPGRVLVLDGYGMSGRVQNHSIGHFDYGGVWGTLHVNIGSVGKLEIGVEANGDEGDFIMNILTGEIRLRSRLNASWTIEHWPARTPYASWPGVYESVSAFLDAVESHQPSSKGALTVARLNLVGLAAEESKDTGTWARVAEMTSIG